MNVAPPFRKESKGVVKLLGMISVKDVEKKKM